MMVIIWLIMVNDDGYYTVNFIGNDDGYYMVNDG